jgi:hypothetical protein
LGGGVSRGAWWLARAAVGAVATLAVAVVSGAASAARLLVTGKRQWEPEGVGEPEPGTKRRRM